MERSQTASRRHCSGSRHYWFACVRSPLFVCLGNGEQRLARDGCRTDGRQWALDDSRWSHSRSIRDRSLGRRCSSIFDHVITKLWLNSHSNQNPSKTAQVNPNCSRGPKATWKIVSASKEAATPASITRSLFSSARCCQPDRKSTRL